mgnify:CR=1 FL=1
MISTAPIMRSPRAMRRPWRNNLSANGWRARSGFLAAMAVWALSACTATVQPIQASRMPERLPDTRWAVTDGWLQDHYEQLRLLRLGLDRCEAARDAAPLSGSRP